MFRFGLFYVIILFSTLLIYSCEGDCKDVQIEKVEWVTRYIDQPKDTLVTYTVTESKREYIEYFKEIKHSVSIRNDNPNYSNYFALILTYGYQDYEEEMLTEEFEFVSIAPGESYTFVFYSQAGKFFNYNNSYFILQKPISVLVKQRIDELKTEKITVNSCKENVEALREKAKVVKELYESKKQ